MIEKDNMESSVYKQGDYMEFCRGPHVPSTGYIKAFKLLSVSSTNYVGSLPLKCSNNIAINLS